MRVLLIAILSAGLFAAACGPAADQPGVLNSPAGPTAVVSSGIQAVKAPAVDAVEVPFHSEIAWTKVVNGGDPGPCLALHGAPPAGTSYLMRNTNEGSAVSTHLGAGEYENHTCVYGILTPFTPKGWVADIRWIAANGDVLLATSDFLYWTGQPGKSVAVDRVRFQDGGTGRFQYARGEGMSYVDAPGKTALYDGTLRYGKKEK